MARAQPNPDPGPRHGRDPGRDPGPGPGHDTDQVSSRDPGRKHKEERRSPITGEHGPRARCFFEIARHALEPGPGRDHDHEGDYDRDIEYGLRRGPGPGRGPGHDHDANHEQGPEKGRPYPYTKHGSFGTTSAHEQGCEHAHAGPYPYAMRGSFGTTSAYEPGHEGDRDPDPEPDPEHDLEPYREHAPGHDRGRKPEPDHDPGHDTGHGPAATATTAPTAVRGMERRSCHQARSGPAISRSRWRARNMSHFPASCAFQRPSGSCR